MIAGKWKRYFEIILNLSAKAFMKTQSFTKPKIYRFIDNAVKFLAFQMRREITEINVIRKVPQTS